MAENRFHARARRQAALIARADPTSSACRRSGHYRLPGAAANGRRLRGALDPRRVRRSARGHAALRSRRGGALRVAATVTNFDTAEIAVTLPGLGTIHGLPFTINGKNALLLAKDRDVILRRDGVPTQPVAFAGCQRLRRRLQLRDHS